MKIIRPADEDQRISPAPSIYLAGGDEAALSTLARIQFERMPIVFDSEWNGAIQFDRRMSNPDVRYHVEWKLARLEACTVPIFILGEDISDTMLMEIVYAIASRTSNVVPRAMPLIINPHDIELPAQLQVICNRDCVVIYPSLSQCLSRLQSQIDSKM